MARLRLALAQVNPVVGDLDGNAEWSGTGLPTRSPPGHTSSRSPRWCSPATRSRTSRCAVVRRGVPPRARAARRRPRRRRPRRRAGRGRLSRPRRPGALDSAPAGRSPLNARRSSTAAASSLATRSTTCRTTASSTSTGSSCRATSSPSIRVHGVDIALAICEDLWQDGGPVAAARYAAADLLVINGSPYERNKDDVRLELVRRRAAQAGCPLAYVNMVGGQDELVFDGDSIVVDRRGGPRPRAAVRGGAASSSTSTWLPSTVDPARSRPASTASWSPTSRLSRTTPTTRRSPRARPRRGGLRRARRSGLRDYVARTASAASLLGVSGGIDSALVAMLAADAIGAESVFGISMPSAYSSDHSKADAADLAERTWPGLPVVPIAPMVDAFRTALDVNGIAAENIQARVRGVIVMALSNEHGHLVLATGNKSELAVGYSTIYGDSVGGFAPIKDVHKTMVWAWPVAQRGTRARRATADPGRRSPSRPRPSCGRASRTRTDCRRTSCSTTSSTTTSEDRGRGGSSAPASTPRPSTRSSGSSTGPSTSAVSSRRDRRSRRWPSVRTAACRSPAAGGRRTRTRSR